MSCSSRAREDDVHVGVVSVGVGKRRVLVMMRVARAGRDWRFVLMIVMALVAVVVNMLVVVLHQVVKVFVSMNFGQVKHQADGHQRSPEEQGGG